VHTQVWFMTVLHLVDFLEKRIFLRGCWDLSEWLGVSAALYCVNPYIGRAPRFVECVARLCLS